jgi:hypothetical protein
MIDGIVGADRDHSRVRRQKIRRDDPKQITAEEAHGSVHIHARKEGPVAVSVG